MEVLYKVFSYQAKSLETYVFTRKIRMFKAFEKVELRGIEPLSENPSITASPITVSVLTFPPPYAQRQA